jgi:N-acetylornithine carbamoyltransferase
VLFFDRSLRTRVAFEVAMVQLGGHCVNISGQRDIYQLEPEERAVMDGRANEHVKDAAATLSRYLDALAVRHLGNRQSYDTDRLDPVVSAYAKYASVPVLNMESTMHHPCQAVADVMTMRQRALRLAGRRLSITWTNHPEPQSMGAAHSLLCLAATMGMHVTLAQPLGFDLEEKIMQVAQRNAERGGGSLRVVNDLETGVTDAEFVYACSWGPPRYYGDSEREALVKRSLGGWQITTELMRRSKDAWFMHPLPVRRNVGVADAVLDGERSIVYDQAENRLHSQKAILVDCLK